MTVIYALGLRMVNYLCNRVSLIYDIAPLNGVQMCVVARVSLINDLAPQ